MRIQISVQLAVMVAVPALAQPAASLTIIDNFDQGNFDLIQNTHGGTILGETKSTSTGRIRGLSTRTATG